MSGRSPCPTFVLLHSEHKLQGKSMSASAMHGADRFSSLGCLFAHLAATTHYYLNRGPQEYYQLFKKVLPITSPHSSTQHIPMHSMPQSRMYDGDTLNCRVGNGHRQAHLDREEPISPQRAEYSPPLLSKLTSTPL